MDTYSETPDIVAFPTSFRSELLEQTELETLKGGTLRLLDEVGVHFPSRQALEIMADHGAKVDMETEIVRIPPTDEQSELHGANLRIVSSIVNKPYVNEMDLLRLRKALLMCRMSANSTYLVDKQKPGHSSKLAALDDWSEAALERTFEDVRASHDDLAMGKLAQPVRVAITGTSTSPGIFETLAVLGKTRSVGRLAEAVHFLRHG